MYAKVHVLADVERIIVAIDPVPARPFEPNAELGAVRFGHAAPDPPPAERWRASGGRSIETSGQRNELIDDGLAHARARRGLGRMGRLRDAPFTGAAAEEDDRGGERKYVSEHGLEA
jgi:hypothetical protein